MKTARQMAGNAAKHIVDIGVSVATDRILEHIPLEALVKCAEACKAWIIAQDACQNASEFDREERILERKKAEMQMREALAVLEGDI